MWTIKEGETPRSKFERMAEMKSRLLDLKESIREIVSLEVYFNSPLAPIGNYDVVLVSEFRSWADLEAYQKHPAHTEVGNYIANVKQNRAAIDFEFEPKASPGNE